MRSLSITLLFLFCFVLLGISQKIIPTVIFQKSIYERFSEKIASNEELVGTCLSGDCQNGWGQYKYETDVYEGFWKNGKKHGIGSYRWEGLGSYIGNWNNGKMSGYGEYITKKGNVYWGQHVNGKLNGYGAKFANKKLEPGIFADGKITSTFSNQANNVLTGCTHGNCQNGYGWFKYKNGDRFEGFYKNGKLFMGKYTFKSGGRYSGMFANNDKIHGTGVYTSKDGSTYFGEWKNGKYHGLGAFVDSEIGQMKVGQWNSGTLVTKMN